MEIYSNSFNTELLFVKVFLEHGRTIILSDYPNFLKFPETALIIKVKQENFDNIRFLSYDYRFGMYERLSERMIKLYPLPLPNIGTSLIVCMPGPHRNLRSTTELLAEPVYVSEMINHFWESEFEFETPYSDKFYIELSRWIKRGILPKKEDRKAYYLNSILQHRSIDFLIEPEFSPMKDSLDSRVFTVRS